MADTESLGESGVQFLEQLAAAAESQRRVRVPTITDPRGIDFAAYKRLHQTEAMAGLERRAIQAFKALGIMMTDTCINYQTIMPPVLGEHLAFGDTGSTIYANSVLGARSNFEGGPAALAAAFTGRVPRYGYHLPALRRGTTGFVLEHRPASLSDWGAVGEIIGRKLQSYWQVPVVEGVAGAPTSDELKHFGAALASFGTVALFHMVGVTPEAPSGSPEGAKVESITAADVQAFYDSYGAKGDKLDVVVFAAPQLSLVELRALAELLQGQRIHPLTTLIFQ
jgi:predicted aconitase